MKEKKKQKTAEEAAAAVAGGAGGVGQGAAAVSAAEEAEELWAKFCKVRGDLVTPLELDFPWITGGSLARVDGFGAHTAIKLVGFIKGEEALMLASERVFSACLSLILLWVFAFPFMSTIVVESFWCCDTPRVEVAAIGKDLVRGAKRYHQH